MTEDRAADRVDLIVSEWHQRLPDHDFTTHEVVSRVLRAAHYLQARLDTVASAYGLSHRGDLEVLTDLHRAENRSELTPSELAGASLLTAGGMTVRLNRLQSAGLIDRRPNPRDGRGVLVLLTADGKQLVEDALPALLEAQMASLHGLESDERDQLAGLLRTLLVSLGDRPAHRPAVAVRRTRG